MGSYSFAKRIMGIVLALVVILGCAGAFMPYNVYADPDNTTGEEVANWPENPDVKAPAAILMDLSTGAVLYRKNDQEAMYPASTTKIMSVLLAIEQCPLSDVVTMSNAAITSVGWDSSRIGVVTGEELSMENCLYSILLASANEVCYAVAEHVAGGSVQDFVGMMNRRAADLGCVNTNFANPHGLHDDNHYTCAYDLALIMKKCVEYTTFCRISNNHYCEIPPTNKTKEARVLAQTHQILRKKIKYQGVYAGKTGHTDEAGNCLVTVAERDGLNLVCVVMGESASDDCYTDTMALFDYGFNNFEYINYGGSNAEDGGSAFPSLFSDEEAFANKKDTVLALSEAMIVLPKGADTKKVVNKCKLSNLIRIEIGKNVIGRAEFYYEDVRVGETDIIYTSDTYEVLDVAADYYDRLFGTEEFDEEVYNRLQGILPELPEEKKDLRPTIIGITVATLIFFIGIFLVVRISLKKR